MLRNIVHLSLRSFHSVEILKTINLKPAIPCRYSTKWSSRRPVAIVNEDELFDGRKPTVTESRTKRQKVYTYKTRNHRPKAPEKKRDTSKEKADDEPMYTALEADSKIMSSLMLKTKTSKLRGKNSLMLLEGFRLIKDAMEAKVVPKIVFFSRVSDILPLSLPDDVKLYKIPYRTIQLWSNLTTSPIFDIPDIKDKEPPIDAIPLTIICDNIREPGNLGTIIRAAAAVGCERLLLMKGCVDLWDPKVLRSAVGAHFRLPISKNLSWNEIPSLIKEEAKIFLADNNITSVVNKIMSQFPVVPYYTLDFTKREAIFVIGGETEGVSLNACKFLRDRNCTRVNVPLTNGVDSLNVGVAVGIVTFEMRKQFTTRNIDDE
ncbi:RNA methyltransferase-like protein [Ooceraea biroi]|uniref:RNA methyltransferase-like protein n=1 Tax=Ooceraea biroi TaxID=2015173 RepID=A0A026WJV7_OOCBI|nr:RNA methyltransferase-like protein [Ooceraea biroi]